MGSTGRRVLLLAAVLTVLTIGTITAASAHWLGSGGGSGSAGTGTTQPVTLSPATPAAQLYPGGQTAVVLNVTNPNAGSIRVGSLALDAGQGSGGFAVDSGHSTCVLSSLSFTTQTNGGAGWTIPGGGSVAVTLTDSLSMSAGAVNACQGASFTVFLEASP